MTLGFHIASVSVVKFPRLCALLCFCSWLPAVSQSIAEWPTGSFDQQRDAWQRNETRFTVDNVKDIRLLWKLKTNNKTMGMQSFREPVIVAAGGRTLALLAGSANAVFAVDVATGALAWQKQLAWSSTQPQEAGEGRGFICTNALTATPVVTPAGAAQRFVYVLASDGYLHTLDVATGDEKDPPIQMLPAAYGKAYGLNLLNNVVYTTTGQGCHGVPNKLYGVDLATRKVFTSSPPQAGIFGTAVQPRVPMERSISKVETARTTCPPASYRPAFKPIPPQPMFLL